MKRTFSGNRQKPESYTGTSVPLLFSVLPNSMPRWVQMRGKAARLVLRVAILVGRAPLIANHAPREGFFIAQTENNQGTLYKLDGKYVKFIFSKGIKEKESEKGEST